MYLKKLLFITLSLSLCTHSMTAQIVGDLLQITLQDQSIINGKLIEKKGDDWVIETKSVGNISLKRQNMLHFEVLTNSQIGSFKNPAPPHYWSAHTAIPLEKGEGYYQASDLVFHSVNYGFTKYFSVSGGIEILSLVNGSSQEGPWPRFAYVSPRFSYPISPNFYLSTGVLIGRDREGSLFNGMTNSLNVLYATATLGNRNHNLSFTYGHRLEKILRIRRFTSFISEPQDMNFISLAGKVRLAERWTLLAESWSWTSVFSEDRTTFLSFGARYSARRFNIGLGILTPFFEGNRDESIPILTFGLPF
jgi:hypothetical protein